MTSDGEAAGRPVGVPVSVLTRNPPPTMSVHSWNREVPIRGPELPDDGDVYSMNWNRVCAYAAWLTAFFVVVPTILVALATPDYSHVSQFISELGAREAPLATAMNLLGFLPAGMAAMVFVVAAWKVLPRSTFLVFGLFGVVAYAAGYLVAVPFPCDPGCRPEEPSVSQIVHNLGGLLGYGLAPITLLLLSRATWTWNGARRLSRWALVGSIVSLVGLLTMSPESPWVGVSQRLIEAAMLGWIVLCGATASRIRTGPAEP